MIYLILFAIVLDLISLLVAEIFQQPFHMGRGLCFVMLTIEVDFVQLLLNVHHTVDICVVDI